MARIKKGDKIKINDKVVETLIKMDFVESSAKRMKKFEGTKQTAHDVYQIEKDWFITVDLGCEIPFQCCTKVK